MMQVSEHQHAEACLLQDPLPVSASSDAGAFQLALPVCCKQFALLQSHLQHYMSLVEDLPVSYSIRQRAHQ